tara:strand:+ start:83 stop:439 length:357 start_codon:yes stop_codon:yes gene_type:complete
MNNIFKYEEIKEYFDDFIANNDEAYISEIWDDLHHNIFNLTFFITNRHKAIKWLGEESFNIINEIKIYEMEMFGEVYTDLSEPADVVNMYFYIVGERIVYDWQEANYHHFFEDEEVSA